MLQDNPENDKTRTFVTLAEGTTVSHYKVISKIGAGGMGEVYLAEDTQLKRKVALKFLPNQYLNDQSLRDRFTREAQASAKLDHPNIVPVYEVSKYQGRPFFAMANIEGQTLSEVIKEGKLSTSEAIDLTMQICEGLHEAHSTGVVHRDIKPGNIIIDNKGRPRILDFGLAMVTGEEKLTKTGSTLGTVGYMSPEQLEGKKVDHRSDLFSVGVILYEMLTGRRPFEGDSDAAVVRAIADFTPEPVARFCSNVPQELQDIVDRTLDKNIETRYQTASGLVADLKRLKKVSEVSYTTRQLKEPRSGKIHKLLITGSVVAVIVLLLLIFKPWELGDQPTQEVVGSIAVLPFENLMGDPDQDYFVDGMTDALITDLSKIGALRVISRTSVMRYKDIKKTLPEIARELGVDAVLEGSVLRSGDRVRITAQLIGTKPERHLWADNYERDLSHILALQSEVAQAIAREIKVVVTPKEKTRLANTRPINPEAYEVYLKGMFYLNQFTLEGSKKGMAYLHQAIEIDPADPLLYARLALAYNEIGHGPGAPPEAYPRAKAAALKALELDETLAEAHAALAEFKLYYEWDWKGAEQAFRRALQLNPNLAPAHGHYAWFLALFGRVDEALAEGRRAKELDPLTPLWSAWLGWLHYWSKGQYEEAIYETRKSLELNPDFPCGLYVLGDIYAAQGMYEEAIAAHQKAAVASPFWKWGLGYTYALAGQRDEARKVAAEMKEAKRRDVWGLAEIYTALGEKDEAIRWLEEGFEARRDWIPWIGSNPNFDPLHNDPRFQNLLRRLNLPE